MPCMSFKKSVRTGMCETSIGERRLPTRSQSGEEACLS
jgi:hypothetical protein